MNPQDAYCTIRSELELTLHDFLRRVSEWEGEGLTIRTSDEIASVLRGVAGGIASLVHDADREIERGGDYACMFHVLVQGQAAMTLLNVVLRYLAAALSPEEKPLDDA